MTNFKTSLKQVVIAGGALFVAIAAPIEASRYMGYDVDVISVAAAEESHAGRASTKGTKAGTGSQTGGKVDQASGGSKSSKSVEALLKGDGGSGKGGQGGSGASGKGGSSSAKGGPTDESDAPAWAGVPGGKSGGGGKPGTAGSKKGDLYGDLFVLIRNIDTGVALPDPVVPTLPAVQAYISVEGKLVPLLDAAGNPVPYPRLADGTLVENATINNVPVFTKEVEFGRLSVGRSPTKVLDHSLVEAVTKLYNADLPDTPYLEVVFDAAGRLAIKTTDPVTGAVTIKAIDSPLENLALFKAIANLPDGVRTISVTTTSKDGGTTSTMTWTIPSTVNIELLKASLLAAASDKTGTLTLDTVMYMLPIIGVTDDLSAVSYDRLATYSTVKTTVLVTTDGGVTWKPVEVSVYDAVFGKDSTNVVITADAGATAFAQAADDALQVLEFIHEYAVPVLPATTVATPTAPVATDTKDKK